MSRIFLRLPWYRDLLVSGLRAVLCSDVVLCHSLSETFASHRILTSSFLLSIHLSIHLFIDPSIHLFICLSFYILPRINRSLYQSIFAYISTCLSVLKFTIVLSSMFLSNYTVSHLFTIYIAISISFYLASFLLAFLFTYHYLSIHLSIYHAIIFVPI